MPHNNFNPYIDDIIVGTRFEPGGDLLIAHDKDLRRVMELLRKGRFMCDIQNCHFFVDEVEFCGNILGGSETPSSFEAELHQEEELTPYGVRNACIFGVHKLLQRVH